VFRDNSPRFRAVNALKKFDCGFRNLLGLAIWFSKTEQGHHGPFPLSPFIEGVEAYM
jgi:hypothetical protein